LRSGQDQFINDPLTAAYASNLEPMIERFQLHLWVHGHLHNSTDCKIGLTRVVCNPRGYAPSALNPQFDPELVIEVLLSSARRFGMSAWRRHQRTCVPASGGSGG
jgi:hypothetical protein